MREATPRKRIKYDDRGKSGAAPTPRLTVREEEVLQWMAQGKRDAEIARIMNASPRTTEKHVASVLAKFSAETRGAAVSVYYERIIAELKNQIAQLGAELRRARKQRR